MQLWLHLRIKELAFHHFLYLFHTFSYYTIIFRFVLILAIPLEFSHLFVKCTINH
ncbi:hypothetical protein BTH41_01719 [Bacillus mycoides]|nr:hypothetical protein BTH41_01719 [Bacillus mycoides]